MGQSYYHWKDQEQGVPLPMPLFTLTAGIDGLQSCELLSWLAKPAVIGLFVELILELPGSSSTLFMSIIL